MNFSRDKMGHRSGFAVKTAWILTVVLLISFGKITGAQAKDSIDISHNFDILFFPVGSYDPHSVLSDASVALFRPLQPPENINRIGYEAWLKTDLSSPGRHEGFSILEVPGQIFNYLDVWYVLPDGGMEHFRAGDRYPYVDRAIKNASYAFPVPPYAGGNLIVLIRARNDTTHPMNFAARLWQNQPWTDYMLGLRLWYGIFLGGMLALAGYNLLLGASLKDSSYLFYVGYILSIVAAVMLLSGLSEEYLWPEGKPLSLVSAFNGMGAFFGVGFVNRFLGIDTRYPLVFRASLIASIVAMVAGVWLAFHDALPGLPDGLSAALVQLLSLSCAAYFIGISLKCYSMKLVQARFLALGMGALLSSMLVYFSYTHAFLPYNIVSAHILEAGALAEGMLLSLALADRIKILNTEKNAAEILALEIERLFSRNLVEVQERERQSVAEALHDSIGHSVLVLRNQLHQIRQATFARSESRNIDADVLNPPIALCKEVMDDLRRISHDLHPHILARLGLQAALESTLERALDDSGIEWSLDIKDLAEVPVDRDVNLAIYRVVQEALSNILKYSSATTVNCTMRVNGHKLMCSISDNGIGFDSEAVAGDALGLQESAGRIRVLGGVYSVRTSPGAGTEVGFWLPIPV
ncbi:hypothetical protein E2F43_18590 [Seongchinamella unica]|uniref:Oxygen sensor histidine kinase NreB n=1 Tax=Seongchinamella unica TaxID=2547392 RepID=A0A4R5LN64_9GAMM|nr:7TM diverse intracellular signaling domain-containing protein [Seongchinamella unica]TDG11394.1 hypothetical protein E2F43_18590 [Seongchinamella unica]